MHFAARSKTHPFTVPFPRRHSRIIAFVAAIVLPALGNAQAQQSPPGVPEPDGGQASSAAGNPGPRADARRNRIERALADAEAALGAGRIMRPPGDNAWYFYRQALEENPWSVEAVRGLLEVQERIVDRAVAHARELDFEAAHDVVREARRLGVPAMRLEHAESAIHSIRAEHVSELEAVAARAIEMGDFERAERVVIELIALGDAESAVAGLRRRIEKARVYGGFAPGDIIRDRFLDSQHSAPELVVIPAGSYLMGSAESEKGRKENEGPRHRVRFTKGFALGRTEVTVGQFRVFVESTGYRTDAEKQGFSTVYNHHSGRLAQQEDVDWEFGYDGRAAAENEPVVHVSWNDASRYTQWLARRTAKPYRLPAEAEFEYAVRGGRAGRYWWGEGVPTRVVENLTGEHDTSRDRRQWVTYFKDYGDGYWGPAPAGTFEPNPFGLFDMAGNVAEWVRDCWHDTYVRAPSDGSAWINPGCKLRVIRGGYWASPPDQSRSAFRLSARIDRRDARVGFRIARDL